MGSTDPAGSPATLHGIIEEEVLLPLPSPARGHLAGTLAYPHRGPGRQYRVLLLSPHPNFGGDRHNNLMRALRVELAARGWVTLAFDYHGVGGSTTEDLGEESAIDHWDRIETERDHRLALRDARAALAYLRGTTGGCHGVLTCGYSYGTIVEGLALGAEPVIRARVWLGPPYRRHHFTPPEPPPHAPPLPHLILSGSKDFLYDEGEAARLGEAAAVRTAVLADADHFFRTREPEVARQVCEFLEESDR